MLHLKKKKISIEGTTISEMKAVVPDEGNWMARGHAVMQA
jgi:hypothetical protein